MTKTSWFVSAALASLATLAAVCAPRPVRADDKPAAPGGEPKKERPAAPAFKVKDVDGKERTLEEFKGKWVVLEWTNLGCPFVTKHYDPGAMQALQKTWTDKGVVWLSVCSSAPGKQGSMEPDAWKQAIAEKKIASTAVLLDGDGTMGHAYGARTTPHLWVVCPKGTIWYTGAIDDNPSNAPESKATRNYVVEALEAGLAGKEPEVTETKPYGCSVKYAK